MSAILEPRELNVRRVLNVRHENVKKRNENDQNHPNQVRRKSRKQRHERREKAHRANRKPNTNNRSCPLGVNKKKNALD